MCCCRWCDRYPSAVADPLLWECVGGGQATGQDKGGDGALEEPHEIRWYIGGYNKAFQHVETLFIQGSQVHTDQNKPPGLVIKKEVCFDQYELDYLRWIKFLHVEMPYSTQKLGDVLGATIVHRN